MEAILKMPASYVEIDSEEMEYLDGGWSFFGLFGSNFISRSVVAAAIDVIAMAVCPYLAPVKYLGKQAAKSLVSKYLPQLAGIVKKLVSAALGLSINVASGSIGSLIFNNAWCLTSVGGIAGLVWDYCDGRVDGKCSW